MIEDDDEVTQRFYREGKLTHTISRPPLRDQGSWLSGGCISECLQWLQKEHEEFQCMAYVIGCPFQLEKVCRIFERRLAGGRFKGAVGTVANVYGAHWAAVYISKTEKSVEYFDPEGSPPPCSLEMLLGMLAVRVGREVGGSAFKVMSSKRVHQKGGARCGLYSLTYIFRRLDGKKSFMDFSEGPRIGDEELADVAATLFEDPKCYSL
jgi:hypothetical protein